MKKEIISVCFSLLILYSTATFAQGPGEPYNPMTAPGAEGVLPGSWFNSNHYLKWKNPVGTLYNEVYLSDDSLSVALLDTSSRILNGYPNTVYKETIPTYPNYEYYKKYFWRIVEYDSNGTSLGPLWYYRTRVWPGETFEEHFDSLDQWIVLGPSGYNNWELGFCGANNDPPELQFNWYPSFDGISRIVYNKTLPGGYSTNISFKHLLSVYLDTVTVGLAYSSNWGDSWNSLWEKRGSISIGPEEVNLTSYLIDEIFILGFYFSGNSFNLNSWCIDNFTFSHPIETYDPPGFLQVIEDSVNQKVTLNWTPGYLPGPLSYKIKRKIGLPTDSTSYSTIGYACDGLLYYEDFDVQPNSIYTYRVHSVYPCTNNFATSIGGNEATAYIPDIPTSIESETIAASEFSLEQNFPNPFNPVTKIKYTIPSKVNGEMSNVSLMVYDILGNEVTTLVNEQKPAGTYEVEFNAESHSGNVRNLPSGIYFYQLKAGSFIETKKMILIK